MRTFYNIADLSLPVMAEHLGAEWNQGVIIRLQGFPHFHWLQTKSGMGAFWVRDKRYELSPGMGILIAPGVPHRYEPLGKRPWQVRFATFQGQLVDDLLKQMVNSEFV
ncbi:MAG TPA: histidine kinase, partial [Weissella confusa]|nr:histidine kinase [Weissella confusa]